MIITPILRSCKHLQNEGKVPAEPGVQTPAPPPRNAKNSVNLLTRLVEQKWVICHVHSFGQLCHIFFNTWPKTPLKPVRFTRLAWVGHTSDWAAWTLKIAAHFVSQATWWLTWLASWLEMHGSAENTQARLARRIQPRRSWRKAPLAQHA